MFKNFITENLLILGRIARNGKHLGYMIAVFFFLDFILLTVTLFIFTR